MYRPLVALMTATTLAAPAFAERPAVCNSPTLSHDSAFYKDNCVPKTEGPPLVCDPRVTTISPEAWAQHCKDVPIEDETFARRVKLIETLDGICKDYVAGKVGLPEEFRIAYCPNVPAQDGTPEWILVRASEGSQKAEASYKKGVRDGKAQCEREKAIADGVGKLLELIAE